jgi:hypothetical protein
MTRQFSSQTSTSSRSQASDESSQSTSCSHSPQKKKLNSATNFANAEGDDTGKTYSVHKMTIDNDTSQSRFSMDALIWSDLTLSSTKATYADPEFPPLSQTQPPSIPSGTLSSLQHRSQTNQSADTQPPSLSTPAPRTLIMNQRVQLGRQPNESTTYVLCQRSFRYTAGPEQHTILQSSPF